MKTTKFYSAILAILGIQLPSCSVQEDEYGCPYADFKVFGTISDSDGNAIEDARVNLEFSYKEDFRDVPSSISHTIGEKQTNEKGEYIINSSEANYGYFRLITEKNGYTPDTTKFIVRNYDYIDDSNKTWFKGYVYKLVNITLKESASNK